MHKGSAGMINGSIITVALIAVQWCTTGGATGVVLWCNGAVVQSHRSSKEQNRMYTVDVSMYYTSPSGCCGLGDALRRWTSRRSHAMRSQFMRPRSQRSAKRGLYTDVAITTVAKANLWSEVCSDRGQGVC